MTEPRTQSRYSSVADDLLKPISESTKTLAANPRARTTVPPAPRRVHAPAAVDFSRVFLRRRGRVGSQLAPVVLALNIRGRWNSKDADEYDAGRDPDAGRYLERKLRVRRKAHRGSKDEKDDDGAVEVLLPRLASSLRTKEAR